MTSSSDWPVLASPRPRRFVSGPVIALLRPLFRYSRGRDAYVLRVVGNRFGPVLRRDRRRERRRAGGLVTQ